MLAKTFSYLALMALPLVAEVTTRAVPVHLQADASSKILRLVKSGETLPETAVGIEAPSGWTPVSLTGPHEVFVENKFISKELSVKPGSPLHMAAEVSSPVLVHASEDDQMEIIGLRGRWTQLRLEQPVIGYVFAATGLGPRGAPEANQTILPDAPADPTTPTTTIRSREGKAVTRSAAERQSLATLPRLFEGVLASTRSPLRPRRPYEFALETENGTPIAYLDLAQIRSGIRMDDYRDQPVVVYGVARPVPQTKDIVITVESLQLR